MRSLGLVGKPERSEGAPEEPVQKVTVANPLDDLSVLIRIPKVRALIEDVVQDCADQWGDDYLWEKHIERFARPWLDALKEANELTCDDT